MRLAAVLTLVLGFGRRHIHCSPLLVSYIASQA